MKATPVGFIGGGRVTRILLEGWRRADATPVSVAVAEPDQAVRARLTDRFPDVIAETDPAKAAAQSVVFLALHPPAVAAAAPALRNAIRPETLVISLAPKIRMAQLGELLGGHPRLARVIPNAPSVVGAGYNPVAFAPDLPAGDRDTLLALLSPLGDCPVVAEEHLEAYAVLTAMGPTYLWFQLQTLREIVAGFGLPEPDVARALKRTVCGATRTLLESGLTPAEVMDLIPVRPMGDVEAQVSEQYRTRLLAIYQKIKPAVQS